MIFASGAIGCYPDLGADQRKRYFFWLEDDDVPGRRRVYLKIRDHPNEHGDCSCWIKPFQLNLDREADALYSINWIENPNEEWSRKRGLARSAIALAVLKLESDVFSDPRRRSGKAHDVHLALLGVGLAGRTGDKFTYRYDHVKTRDLSAMHVLLLETVD